MKTILVPTDFSETAGNALNYAIGLAKAINTDIVLLNAWEVILPATDIPLYEDLIFGKVREAELNSTEQLRYLCQQANASADVQCRYISRQGPLVDVVLGVIDDYDVGLVVMGTKGAGGMKKFFAGSNTAKILQKARCPVIAVPEGIISEGVRKITYATNYLASDTGALKKLVDMARLLQAEITLLHIADESYSREGAEAMMRTFSARVKAEVHYDKISFRLIYGKNIEEELDLYVRQEHADLLVVSTLHRNMFDRLFGNSLAGEMAYHSKVPLMAFHHTENTAVFI